MGQLTAADFPLALGAALHNIERDQNITILGDNAHGLNYLVVDHRRLEEVGRARPIQWRIGCADHGHESACAAKLLLDAG
jgi:hypothetical protein